MKSAREALIELVACDEAVEWVGKQSPEQAWAECERGEWMLWLLGKLAWQDGDPFGTDRHRKLVACLVDVVNELAAPHWRGQDRKVLAECVAMLASYSSGETVTRGQILELRRSAYDAADAAAGAAAAYAAAYDAAYAAAVAAAAAAAAYAYAAVARKKSLKQSADIVRRHYPTAPVLKGD